MMNLYKKASLAAAAIAMAATPVIASAAPAAQKLSVAAYAQARDGAESAEESEFRGRGAGTLIIALLAAAAIIAAIVIAADGDDSDPTSP